DWSSDVCSSDLGVSRKLPQPFIVIATQNPSEHHGTYPLPESQLDRFMLRLHMGYPSMDDERAILHDRERSDPLDQIEPVLTAEDVRSEERRVGKNYRCLVLPVHQIT